MPAGPIPIDLAPLDAQLAGVLRATGGQAARAVDSRRGVVVAEVGLAAGDDVAALVQLARGAASVAAARGEGFDDLVVTTDRTVHVLRECEQPGVVLHVRLDRDRGDVGAARRALGAASLQQSVRAALEGPAGPPPPATPPPTAPLPNRPLPNRPLPSRPLPSPALPVRVAVPLPRPSAGRRPAEQQPALVTLAGGYQPRRAGALAVLALQPVESEPAPPDPAEQPRQAQLHPVEPQRAETRPAVLPQPAEMFRRAEPRLELPRQAAPPPAELVPAPAAAPAAVLPRRRPSPRPVLAPAAAPHPAALSPAPAVLQQTWAHDMGTMQRLLDALRKLA